MAVTFYHFCQKKLISKIIISGGYHILQSSQRNNLIREILEILEAMTMLTSLFSQLTR